MEYHHTVERSTELLRKVLPLMSRQAAAFHPVSYAVWYAYVADADSPLHRALDELLSTHGALDEAATEALYRRYLAEPGADTAQRVADGVNRLLDGMQASATAAGDESRRYGHSLQRLSAAIDPTQPASHAPEALEELREHTLQMQSALEQLQHQLVESQREINALRDEVRHARHESLVDALTGLGNRRAFDRRLASCLAVDASTLGLAPSGAPLSLLLLDIDHFKQVNDNHGHAFGDQVLGAVAQVLKALTPEGAFAARVGGEEFAVLLPGLPVAEAQSLAEQLRTTVAGCRIRRKGAEATDERITVSLGVAQYGRRSGSELQAAAEAQAAFVDRADRALYAAKQAGRDRVVVAQP